MSPQLAHNPAFLACPHLGRYQSQSRYWDPTAPLIMGLDIARQGADQSVIRFRPGLGCVIPPVAVCLP